MKQVITLTEEDVKRILQEHFHANSVEIRVGTRRECVDPYRQEYQEYGVFKEAVVVLPIV